MQVTEEPSPSLQGDTFSSDFYRAVVHGAQAQGGEPLLGLLGLAVVLGIFAVALYVGYRLG